jgi:hypothetical protein
MAGDHDPRFTRAGCLIVTAGCVPPILVAAVTPGPWWLRALLFLCASSVVVGGLPWLVRHHMVVPAADPDAVGADGPVLPGPDDPVHYIDFNDRTLGCARLDRHDEHWWYWRADLPVGDTSAVVRGSRRCRGIKSKEIA